MTKAIKHVIKATPLNMGGFRVKQPLPNAAMDQVDPFLLLHHARNSVSEGSRPQHEGVPPHPHRGFEPVTFIYKGGVHHRDSRGNDSIIHEGGVQWMTAGKGIVHSERPPQSLAASGGEQEIIQLWVNLPSDKKNVQPRYQGFQADEIPVVKLADGLVSAQVITGSLLGETGPVETSSPLLAANLSLRVGGHILLPIPPSYSTLVYVLDGEIRVNNEQSIGGEHLVSFDDGGDSITLTAQSDTRVLVLAGEPLNEEVVASGPFVMNSTTEILEAMRDFQMGKMGVLVEEF